MAHDFKCYSCGNIFKSNHMKRCPRCNASDVGFFNGKNKKNKFKSNIWKS
jgi:rubrerythrin